MDVYIVFLRIGSRDVYMGLFSSREKAREYIDSQANKKDFYVVFDYVENP